MCIDGVEQGTALCSAAPRAGLPTEINSVGELVVKSMSWWHGLYVYMVQKREGKGV